MDGSIAAGFGFILIAAVAGGAFGLQYRIMRKYTVENSSLLSLFFATIVVPLVAVQFILPGWTAAIAEVGWATNLLVFALGFGWGLGAITYAYGFNILGMALAASLIKGISIAVGAGIPLARRWSEVPADAKTVTIVGLGVMLLGTAIAGRAGAMREKQLSADSTNDPDEQEKRPSTVLKPTGILFLIGLTSCLVSGVLSACANLGYDFAEPLEVAMGKDLEWRATLIRWMPMYWGGITALIVFMGGAMLKNGTWKNFVSPGTTRDFLVSSSMGVVHFLAQIPYGIGAFYLGTLGTTVGWGVNIGMALIVAASIGFLTGEWKGVSKASVNVLLVGIVVLLAAIGLLGYAKHLTPDVKKDVSELPSSGLAGYSSARVQPEGLRYESPGQRPGYEEVGAHEAPKGRHITVAGQKLITPFQGCHPVIAPLPRALPRAAIFEPFGLADSCIRTIASNSKIPLECRSAANKA